ncbi:hypothetical protein LTR53_016099, partial [Teratosphaeriaceae sp. CCFEE 6253]
YEASFALELNVVPPLAILGVEGLYDLPALVAYHAEEPAYRDFVTNAFGPAAPGVWEAASPTSGQYGGSWDGGRLVVLAHSRGDELVEWEQVALMERALKAQGWGEGSEEERRVEVLELRGRHDQVWEEGEELARAIGVAVEGVRELL